ncbi:MAG: lamin tail domain-containing protein [Thermoplasmata archaeon]|nr:MAG: lamin tail domain-containing protein [Thermoplasmata archaeon]
MKLVTMRALFMIICLLFSGITLISIQVSEADESVTFVVINEFLARPNSDWDGDSIYNSLDDEWIELFNPTDTMINISGCFIGDDGTVLHQITGNSEIPPFGFLVIYGSDYGSLSLNNDGDMVRFLDTDGITEIDTYDYSTSSQDVSEGRETDNATLWQFFDIPTPGRRNLDDPPIIASIHHTPQNPKSSDQITVIVNASDDYVITIMNLSYSVDGMNFTIVEMKDDGIYTDKIADDGIFTASIPNYSSGTTVHYYISCVDDSNHNTLSPINAPLTCHTFAFNDGDIQVVINEFLADPGSDWNGDSYIESDDEWIELFNSGETVVNIGDWVIDDALGGVGSSDPYTIPSGLSIKPREFLVFYGNQTGILLNNNGDNVTLLNETGAVVDVHTYLSSSNDTAIGRYYDGTETWKDFLLPTPGRENHYTVDSLNNLSNIKINEFLPSPKISYSMEWIELINCGLTPVKLDGCLLDDVIDGGTKPWRIPLNTTIAPGEVMLFERNFGLNNNKDTVNLLYVEDDIIIDTFSYEFSEYDISFGRGGDCSDIWASFSNSKPGQLNVPYQEPNSSEGDMVITEFFYKASEEYEFLRLHNPSGIVVDLGGWRILDGPNSYSGTIIFPEDVMIPPSGDIYVANKATIFCDIMGFYPDFEYGNSPASIPDMITKERPSFALGRDEALLLDEFGNIIDVLVYGDSEYDGSGWSGPPVLDAKKGEILKRNLGEGMGVYEDTNTQADWKHVRHYKLGQSDFGYDSFTYTGNMTLFASPDSSYETIIKEIEKAESTIYLSIYQFTNWNISQKIIERLNHGVVVNILIEGSPAGEWEEEQKYVLQMISENGGEIRFLVFNSTLGKRFSYIHSKFAVIDNASVIISSENWKYTGIPVNNTFGNRGWGVVIRDVQAAGYFADVFLEDWSHVSYDIFPFTPEDSKYGNASSDFEPNDWIETGYYDPILSSMTFTGEFKVSPVISPDTSLLESEGILDMINSAVDSIYIEQLEIQLSWDDKEEEYENLYLEAAIEAAEQRNVDVKILLSSKYAFPDDIDLDNYDTFIYINEYALNHNITEYLEARLVDYDRLGLSKMHNKGMIVDGKKTLISSINWKRNSVAQNREAGVIIESEDVAVYFTELFLWDWNEPPKADAGEDITVNAFDEVQFFDLSTDSDDNIESYYWDFDDGTNTTLQNPFHEFEKEGIYEVKLTVLDGQYSDSDVITVVVQKSEKESEDLGLFMSVILLVILLVIIAIIISFIRKMRQLFL